jgi:TonB family protein
VCRVAASRAAVPKAHDVHANRRTAWATCVAVWLALAYSAASAAPAARPDAPSPTPLTLAGVTLGEPVAEVVARRGAPDVVQTTDQGGEWRWFDAGGYDLDLLTDDTLSVRQILVSPMEAVPGKAVRWVQPAGFPYLGATRGLAEAGLRAAGGAAYAQPNPNVSVWQFAGGLCVLELRGQTVARILVLGVDAAKTAGFMGSGPPLGSFFAPRLLLQHAVDYPPQAVAEHAQGVVVVAVWLNASGGVDGVRVIVSSGNRAIDEAEVESMRRSRFRPARCAGQPCPSLYLDREEYTLPP